MDVGRDHLGMYTLVKTTRFTKLFGIFCTGQCPYMSLRMLRRRDGEPNGLAFIMITFIGRHIMCFHEYLVSPLVERSQERCYEQSPVDGSDAEEGGAGGRWTVSTSLMFLAVALDEIVILSVISDNLWFTVASKDRH